MFPLVLAGRGVRFAWTPLPHPGACHVNDNDVYTIDLKAKSLTYLYCMDTRPAVMRV